MASSLGNNSTQYYLFRGKTVSPVCMSDAPQAFLSDVGDAQQAIISQWELSNSIASTSRFDFMEALPSQQIKFFNPSNANVNNKLTLKPQSKEPFQRFHINTKGIGK